MTVARARRQMSDFMERLSFFWWSTNGARGNRHVDGAEGCLQQPAQVVPPRLERLAAHHEDPGQIHLAGAVALLGHGFGFEGPRDAARFQLPRGADRRSMAIACSLDFG